jgi:ABC-type nitrate/sulfonate/bicarbonate transport system substrate-binding protein
MTLSRRTVLASGAALPFALTACAGPPAPSGVRIGQATTSLSFLPIWAARAFDSFAAEGLQLDWAAIPGGDPTALAALDAGDIDLAAVGSDTALAAIGKGQPFVLVYVLMAKMSLELVASNALLMRTGVTPGRPLPERIAALKGATVGVSAVGGAQDRILRWIAGQGGLGKTDLQVAQVGAPPAIQAAMENGRIDAFVLSPPEAGIAEAGGYGRRLIEPARDFPALKGLPNLVLAAKRGPDEATAKRITASLAALNKAAAQVRADPDMAADRIGAKFFPKVPQAILRAAVRSMVDGLEGGGRFTPEAVAALGRFSGDSGTPLPPGDGWWTNRFIA